MFVNRLSRVGCDGLLSWDSQHQLVTLVCVSSWLVVATLCVARLNGVRQAGCGFWVCQVFDIGMVLAHILCSCSAHCNTAGTTSAAGGIGGCCTTVVLLQPAAVLDAAQAGPFL